MSKFTRDKYYQIAEEKGHGWSGWAPNEAFRTGYETATDDIYPVAKKLYEALSKAIADYGKLGGPWNVPSEPGTWIEMAKQALAKADGKE